VAYLFIRSRLYVVGVLRSVRLQVAGEEENRRNG